MNVKPHDKSCENLIKAILTLKNQEEAVAFFDDICTITELQAMSQRLEVSKQLRQKLVYSDIVKNTGASTATISRVNRCLQYGYGGYDLVLDRLKDEDVQ